MIASFEKELDPTSISRHEWDFAILAAISRLTSDSSLADTIYSGRDLIFVPNPWHFSHHPIRLMGSRYIHLLFPANTHPL